MSHEPSENAQQEQFEFDKLRMELLIYANELLLDQNKEVRQAAGILLFEHPVPTGWVIDDFHPRDKV